MPKKRINYAHIGLWPLLIALFAFVAIGSVEQQESQLPPPPKTKVVEVTDNLHGVEIVDPYRWLEDQENPETREWIDAQNAYTDLLLGELPGREVLKQHLTRLMKVDAIGIPSQRSGRYFYAKRKADQDLYVYYVRDGLTGEERVLLDPHTMSEDHTVSVNLQDISEDGKLIVYGVRRGGVDEVSLKFLNVDTLEDLPDSLPEARYYGISLKSDNSGYFYTRREEAGPRLYYRAMGSNPEDEQFVYGEGVAPHQFLGAEVSGDGRWLLISVSEGWSKNDLYLKDLAADGDIVPVVTGIEAIFNGTIEGGRLFIQTNWEAPNSRFMVADPENPAVKNWQEVIPERRNAVLQSVSTAGGRLFARYLENVQSRIVSFDLEGNELGVIKFEAIGTVGNMYGRWDSDEAFYYFSSFHIPPTIFHYKVSTGEQEVWARIDVPVESEKYEITQVRFQSKDGTMVPMFILHARGIELDGNNPTFLTGYGGFNISLTPYFSATACAWVESGGVYAVPNLRGGGEFGEEWHKAGMFGNKQNVFDDFIAAAEYLISKNYTRPEKLAIRGGSNGGLLVTAVMTQRPDLYGAVICTYPLIDMVRYHKFLVGSTWAPEYGSADDPEQFKFLHAYSPYHHVTKGGKYPPVLFITGDGDTRVAPLHARKMTALMQASTGSGEPVILRYHTKAGHSGGMPLSQQIDDATESMSFLFWQLDIKTE